MSSFKGSYKYSVDGKGRINIPARLRKYVSPEANNTFTITRGFESCLFVYPQDALIKAGHDGISLGKDRLGDALVAFSLLLLVFPVCRGVPDFDPVQDADDERLARDEGHREELPGNGDPRLRIEL